MFRKYINYETPSTDPKVRSIPLPLVIPYWFKPVIESNNLTKEDLLNPVRMFKVLSQEDYLEWIVINLGFCEDTAIGQHLYYFSNQVVGVSQRMASIDLCKEVETRFNQNCEDVEPYRLEAYSQDFFFIFMERNFVKALEVREECFNFVSACLKICYQVSPLTDVSKSGLFQKYLELL